MNIVLINSGSGEDYLADLFITAILCNSQHRVCANLIPDYLYDDYSNANKLYGNGYTAFASVPSVLRKSKRLRIDSIDNILNIIRSARKERYQIVYTSIWRFNGDIGRFLDADIRNRCNVIALDGEDHSILHPSHKLPITYYKRELKSDEKYIRPISFRLPVYCLPYIQQGPLYVPSKSYITAPCDPRFRNSYVYNTQSLYYKQYSESLFGVTTRKGGWDCLRHYEILANHCIPYFPGIESKPARTMSDYPIELQREANHLYESSTLSPQRIDDRFWCRYKLLLREFLDCFYSNFTSTSYDSIFK